MKQLTCALSGVLKPFLIALVVVAGIGTLSSPAEAEPFAGDYRYLYGSVSVTGADGARWLLDVGATANGAVSNQDEQRLYIDLSRCAGSKCTQVGRWSRPLTPAEISVSDDYSAGRLRTVLGGVPLNVSLTATPNSTPVSGLAFDSLGIDQGGTGLFPINASPGFSRMRGAVGRLQIGGTKCAVKRDGELGGVDRVDTEGTGEVEYPKAPPSALPTDFMSKGHPAVCTRPKGGHSESAAHIQG